MSTTQKSTTKVKRRWTREEKRQHQEAAGNKARLVGTSAGTGQHRKKRQKLSLSFPEQLVQCATQLSNTKGVFMSLSGKAGGNVRVVTCSNAQTTTRTTSTENGNAILVKPLLIMDLNGILCHRIRKGRPDLYPHLQYRTPVDVRVGDTTVISRVGVEAFLRYLNEHFCLAVWTSAKPKTAKGLLKLLFPETIRTNLVFVWSQNKCQRIPVGGDDDVVFVKSLSKVWKQFPLWNSANTLLMDDSPEKCPEYYYNTLHPPPLNGKIVTANTEQYSDERNETCQLEFITKLAEDHFGEPRQTWPDTNDSAFFDFLHQTARNHMGWRGTTSGSAGR